MSNHHGKSSSTECTDVSSAIEHVLKEVSNSTTRFLSHLITSVAVVLPVTVFVVLPVFVFVVLPVTDLFVCRQLPFTSGFLGIEKIVLSQPGVTFRKIASVSPALRAIVTERDAVFFFILPN